MKKTCFFVIMLLCLALTVSCGTEDLSVDGKRVGHAGFGFLTIPTDWREIRHLNEFGIYLGPPHRAFASPDGSEVLLRFFVFDEDITLTEFVWSLGYGWHQYETIDNMRLDGHNAYRRIMHYPESIQEGYHIVWYFWDGDYMRVITATGPDEEMSKVKAIVENTFSLSY